MNNRHKVARYGDAKKKLIFVGSTHSINEKERVFFKKIIMDFSPEIILLEGGFDIPMFHSESEAVEKGNESGYVNFLARKTGIKLGANDPNDYEVFCYLARKYGFEFSFLFYNLRNLAYCGTLYESFDNEDFKNKILKEFDLKSFDFSENNFREVFKETLGKEFDSSEDYKNHFNPFKKNSVMNEAALFENEFRDGFMILELKRYFKELDRILVIKGSGHLDAKDGELKELFR